MIISNLNFTLNFEKEIDVHVCVCVCDFTQRKNLSKGEIWVDI